MQFVASYYEGQKDGRERIQDKRVGLKQVHIQIKNASNAKTKLPTQLCHKMMMVKLLNYPFNTCHTHFTAVIHPGNNNNNYTYHS